MHDDVTSLGSLLRVAGRAGRDSGRAGGHQDDVKQADRRVGLALGLRARALVVVHLRPPSGSPQRPAGACAVPSSTLASR